jgi:RNA methyltransferase, TrmH family
MVVQKISQCYASAVRAISSRQNPLVARYRAAASGESDHLLLDGVHLVGEALAARLALEHVFIGAEAIDRPELAALLAALRSGETPLDTASASVLDAVSPLRSPSPIVALTRRDAMPHGVFQHASPFVLVACDIQDPGNLGAMARAAEAAGATGLVVAGSAVDPYGWKALRGSMGSLLRLPIDVFSSVDAAIRAAREHHCRVIATTPRGGTPLFSASLTGPIAILVGGEGAGLPAPLIDDADVRISIPMAAPVESLNAAVTAALILYESKRQRG